MTDLRPLGSGSSWQIVSVREAGGATSRWAWWWCPGCQDPHAVPLDRRNVSNDGPWTLGADGKSLTPSVLIIPPAEVSVPRGPRTTRARPLCHCFIVAGRIQFLGDCEHALAGQTVDIPPEPPVAPDLPPLVAPDPPPGDGA